MTIALGIDTGGTYTDAVLVKYDSGQILCAAKVLTTHHDLAIGIGGAIDAAFAQSEAPMAGDVDLVALSTTLATNAIVEGHGSPVCLLLIGYDPELIHQYCFDKELVTDDVVYLAGRHDIHGNEVVPLDEVALREAVLARRDQVEAFAVSGYFGVRNPAHEIRARMLIEELTGLPVTCGHDLTNHLDSIRRATTVALNARLVPLIRELIATLRNTMAVHGLSAPLMVVKGDGSLVRAEWALKRPIETILSGPAASAIGAWHLAAESGVRFESDTLWAIDMGGTTTDIVALCEGRPRLNPEGAQVGRWHTMVEAVDVHTVGLGGDSRVRFDADRKLCIGPQRVVPLSLLANQHPQVLVDLANQVTLQPRSEVAAEFLLQRRKPSRRLDSEEQVVWKKIDDGPVSIAALMNEVRYGAPLLRCIEHLVAEQLVQRAGFTPTDALHAQGCLNLWHTEAARLGAKILAAQGFLDPGDLCRNVVVGVSERVSTALVTKVLRDEERLNGSGHPSTWEAMQTAALLPARGLNCGCASLSCTLTLCHPMVAIGAPVESYLPLVAEQLHTRIVIPPHAEVANAAGAVAGGVIQRRRVLITPLDKGGALRVLLPEGMRDFHDLEAAVAFARQEMEKWMIDLARKAGAGHIGGNQIEVWMVRQDKTVLLKAGWGDNLYLGTELIFTSAGRPSPAV
ncbi:MAG: hydantoinase/oxoprolinase family protein [Deltaproteobacteria bacterium]|nr:hydantoinase/oxoprolinase family protein [Deltaproteobacteria bacterium]